MSVVLQFRTKRNSAVAINDQWLLLKPELLWLLIIYIFINISESTAFLLLKKEGRVFRNIGKKYTYIFPSVPELLWLLIIYIFINISESTAFLLLKKEGRVFRNIGKKYTYIFPSVKSALLLLFKRYLTIIPRARISSESIAHETEGRMGYWLRGHEDEGNNCFSGIQLVGQKYRE